MTDLTVTAAKVRPLDGSRTRGFDLGGAAAPGDAVYIASDGDIEKADANVSAATGRGIGLIVAIEGGKSAGVAGDHCTVCVFGPVEGFSSLTPGANGYLSDTAGKLADAAGTQSRIIGYAESATAFFVLPEMNDPSS
jgi:hypothetical protein